MGERALVPSYFLVLFCVQQGVEDVKQHKWFKAVDWDAVLQRKLVVSGEGGVGIGSQWGGGCGNTSLF